jgi:response regulator RpfG family c-di-GMP phosphodiesterase
MTAWVEWALVVLAVWCGLSALVAFWLGARLGGLSEPAQQVPGTGRGRMFQSAAAATLARRVLIVDGDPRLRRLLRTTLDGSKFQVEDVGSIEEAREIVPVLRPGVALLDVSSPGMDGLSFCTELASSRDGETEVILLTAEDISRTTARLAGATAIARKPFSPLDLIGLIEHLNQPDTLLSTPAGAPDEELLLMYEEQLMMYAFDLGRIARMERVQRHLVDETYRQTATALAHAIEAHDLPTALHAQRVQRYALKLAQLVEPALLGDPSLEYGFLLHDVGKIGIRDQVLRKPGPLDGAEREHVQAHPTIGAEILGDISMLRGSGLQVVRHHHERWDGNGYPDRLRGDETPLSARVFALVDTLDAMTSDRPYRRAVGWEGAVEEIVAQSGRQFDPEVVRVFAASEGELRRIYDDLRLVA